MSLLHGWGPWSTRTACAWLQLEVHVWISTVWFHTHTHTHLSAGTTPVPYPPVLCALRPRRTWQDQQHSLYHTWHSLRRGIILHVLDLSTQAETQERQVSNVAGWTGCEQGKSATHWRAGTGKGSAECSMDRQLKGNKTEGMLRKFYMQLY